MCAYSSRSFTILAQGSSDATLGCEAMSVARRTARSARVRANFAIHIMKDTPGNQAHA
jgi:hypothetical protein